MGVYSIYTSADDKINGSLIIFSWLCLSYSVFALFCEWHHSFISMDSGTRIGTLETFDPPVGRGGNAAMNNFKTFGLIMCHYLFSMLQILILKWQIGPALAICHSHHVVALWSCCFHEEVKEIFLEAVCEEHTRYETCWCQIRLKEGNDDTGAELRLQGKTACSSYVKVKWQVI